MVKGLVQGVGFRPFIYRTATSLSLRGTVENRNDGVQIILQGNYEKVNEFLKTLEFHAPQASQIYSIKTIKKQLNAFPDFRIVKSRNVSNEITLVSPDIGVCDDCLEDIKIQEPRIDYPFTNCTNCGPRFTIIKQLPYDRPNTTMKEFVMCGFCNSEYKDVFNRRFHAQPVACKNCGPKYTLHTSIKITDIQEDLLNELSSFMANGKIIAVKGLGGFFLACDANNIKAVERLRSIKRREGKPFAVMFKDQKSVSEYAILSAEEKKLIHSWQRPIVLLTSKRKLAPDVGMGFKTIGAMLPYMPFHYLLFEKLLTNAIVLTSGNLSDEPILIQNKLALDTFLPVCDAVLTYNREIHNRVDDSVMHVVNGRGRFIRRSRGYVPVPINLPYNADGVLAVGAELVNSFCVGKYSQAIMSQHVGDLKNLETYEFFTESIERYKELFRVEPKLIVTDLHPEYLSTTFALSTGLPIMQVQHHHAHIASCMAEHGLVEKVIGIAFDGVGLGDDGNIWGGEFMICDLSAYERITYFDYQTMPGGDQATLNPWRMAVSYLHSIYGKDFTRLKLPFLNEIDPKTVEIVIEMIEKNVNSPLTSSVGRIFDAVSALTGLCIKSTFHAEAPMRLESVIEKDSLEYYTYQINKTISVRPVIQEIVNDLLNSVSVSRISTRFHNTIVRIVVEISEKLRKTYSINKVVLSGGTFQNKYILRRLEENLKTRDFEVYINEKVPSNDGGISLGQLAIAANRNY